MKTKLVYVLTCAPVKYYIEQAVIATYSCRYHNPEAQIVLLVDDKTNKLIENGRKEVLRFIDEKIIIPFSDNSSMMYRSRWIKTNARNLVDGDFLFIDCDTVTTRPIDEIDSFSCLLGAVPDSNLAVKDYAEPLIEANSDRLRALGIELDNEEFYFSSGVLYVKDTQETRSFYQLWHNTWLEGTSNGVYIDQPALAKANIESGHLIQYLPDVYNCIMYTQPDYAKNASILHFAAFQNPSWLFTNKVYEIIKKDGLPDWLQSCILNPVATYKPFRYSLWKMKLSELKIHILSIARMSSLYAEHVDSRFEDMKSDSRWDKAAKKCFTHRLFGLGSFFLLFPGWISLRINTRTRPKYNTCAK